MANDVLLTYHIDGEGQLVHAQLDFNGVHFWSHLTKGMIERVNIAHAAKMQALRDEVLQVLDHQMGGSYEADKALRHLERILMRKWNMPKTDPHFPDKLSDAGRELIDHFIKKEEPAHLDEDRRQRAIAEAERFWQQTKEEPDEALVERAIKKIVDRCLSLERAELIALASAKKSKEEPCDTNEATGSGTSSDS